MKRKDTPTQKQLRAEKRRERVIQAIENGASVPAIAEVEGVHVKTIARDKKALMRTLQNDNAGEMKSYRDHQLTRIESKWQEIEADKTMDGAEKHLAWARWMKLEIGLRGTAAPSKSLHAHLHANYNIPVEQMSDDQLLVVIAREICGGLDDSQIDQVRAFAQSLPRVDETSDEYLLQSVEESESRIRAEHLRPEPESVGPVEIIIDPLVREDEKPN
jgi:hypothetical protein